MLFDAVEPADTNGEAVHVVGQAQQRAQLGLAADVVVGDRRPEPERAAGEDDVLHRRIDAGAADAVEIGQFGLVADFGPEFLARRHRALAQARDQDHRRLREMVPQPGAAAHKALVLRLGQMRGPAARGIDRASDVRALAIDRA